MNFTQKYGINLAAFTVTFKIIQNLIFKLFKKEHSSDWGSKNDSFYNIGKIRQIHFNILPTVYGSEFDDFYLCYKNCHFCFPILYFWDFEDFGRLNLLLMLRVTLRSME